MGSLGLVHDLVWCDWWSVKMFHPMGVRLLLEGMRAQGLNPDDDTLSALALLHSRKPKRESVGRLVVVF